GIRASSGALRRPFFPAVCRRRDSAELVAAAGPRVLRHPPIPANFARPAGLSSRPTPRTRRASRARRSRAQARSYRGRVGRGGRRRPALAARTQAPAAPGISRSADDQRAVTTTFAELGRGLTALKK